MSIEIKIIVDTPEELANYMSIIRGTGNSSYTMQPEPEPEPEPEPTDPQPEPDNHTYQYPRDICIGQQSEPDTTHKDKNGVFWNPDIHGTAQGGGPSYNKNGSFRTRRKLIKENQKEKTKTDDNSEGPATTPPENDMPAPFKPLHQGLYVCKDAGGAKFKGSTVATAREFTTILLQQLNAVRDRKVQIDICTANQWVLNRLRADNEDALLSEIDDAFVDESVQ